MTDIQTLRADFATVWNWWRHIGEISQQELAEGRSEGAEGIRRYMADADLMACCKSHYRAMAEQVARDIARSERIKTEVRNEREAR